MPQRKSERGHGFLTRWCPQADLLHGDSHFNKCHANGGSAVLILDAATALTFGRWQLVPCKSTWTQAKPAGLNLWLVNAVETWKGNDLLYCN